MGSGAGQARNHDRQCAHCGLDFEFDLPPDLVDAAHERKVVLFAGAGVSTEVPSVFPNTFYDQIRAHLPATVPDEDFPKVMGAYEDLAGRPALVRAIKERLDYVDGFPSIGMEARKFHRELATMPYITEVITTNWDTYFEESAGATPFVSGEDFIFHELPGRHVYKIHGSIHALSSLVITESDYTRRLEDLGSNLLGAFLRQLLATKIVVFVGYSLKDWNFRRLYEALVADMGAFRPKAFAVTPYESAEAEELGITEIRTSGVRLLRDLKAALVGHCFVPDEAYDRIERVDRQVREAHRTASEISVNKFPAVMHCWAYQDGMLDAVNRIKSRRVTGEYSDAHHVQALVESYDRLTDYALDEGRYWDAAYTQGYGNGVLLMLDDKDELSDMVPLYFAYGSDSPMRDLADLKKALKKSKKKNERAWQEAKRLSADIEDDMVVHHMPFVSLPQADGASRVSGNGRERRPKPRP